MSKNFKKKSKFSIDGMIKKSNFDYCHNLKWFLIAPVVIIFIGIILLSTVGFNLGIDFTGGSTLTLFANEKGLIQVEKTDEHDASKQYNLNNSSDYNEIRNKINKVLAKQGLSIDIFRTTTMKIDELGLSGGAVQVQYQNKEGASGSEIADTNKIIREELQKAFGYVDTKNVNEDYSLAVSAPEVVTATASGELLMNAFVAMMVAVVLILIYVAFRFELTSGLAAILALFHDLLVMTSFVLIFRIPINSSFVAALVTILGYSINNTIIIFDRIRENIKSGKFEGKNKSIGVYNKEVANFSVKETMTRSLFTTLTTVITISMVAIIGVTDIRQFAVPILIGIIAGFYSSVFITPGLWSIAYRPNKKKKTA